MSYRSRQVRGRIALGAAVLAVAGLVALLAPPSAGAAGNSYHVLKCHSWYRAADQVGASAHGNYPMQDKCTTADHRLQITNSRTSVINQGSQYTVTAPPGTAIVGVAFTANLRRDNHHLAQVAVYNPGGTFNVLMNGPDSNPTWRFGEFFGLSHQQLVIRLFCSNSGGCPASSSAHAYARNIDLVLADRSNPVVSSAGGSLLAGGWLRGSQSFSAQASDVGAGLSRVVGYVNGVEVVRAGSCDTAGLGWPYVGKLSPCSGTASFDVNRNTAQSPFHNGENTVQIKAADFPANGAPTVTRTVHVDNAAPQLAFTNAQDPNDPELIRTPVSDAHSGVASGRVFLRPVGGSDWQPLDTQLAGGELRARVDSSALPPGDYEFRAEAADLAGNAAETTKRENGEAMVLTFPLRLGAELQAHLEPGGSHQQTIPYGKDSHVAGRLLAASGDPLADKQVTVVEHFGDGALIRERVSRVRTDGEGRWDSKLPAGPSRTVAARFDGNQRYLPTSQEAGSLKVRSRASFRTSRKRVPEGGRVKFKGKVRHFGARIPVGGKLIELQVRETPGRWQTVREAFHTKPSGRYRLGYRFGRFYQSDAKFRFRVKIARESDWPYKAPSRSRQRVVRVQAR
ncbi:MAG: hypothetical protein ACRDK9_10340 [Solirubrobacterales bacterium]